VPTYTATTSNGVLRASNTSDIINGNTSNDELWGLGGNDTVYGSDGNDLIEGDGAFTVADQVRVAGFATVSNLGVTGTTTQPLFTAMGQTSLSASIWRVRNLSDAAMTVSVKSANGSFSVDYVVPAHTDYIVSSSVLSTHKLYYNTSLVDTKGVSLSSYVDTTSYGVTVDGNDTIYGGNGNDIIHGGGGDDVISGDAGNDTIDGNAGNDTIDGGTGNDVIHGNDGNDTLTGNYGTDKLYGDAGNDTFLAEWDEGSGDYYDGGDGVDTYKIDGTPVQTYALQIDLAAGTSQYHDTFISVENLIGGSAADVFLGDAGANDLEGRDGNDTLDGRGGNDVLLGENGDDTLIGGDGNDSLAGGTGTDSLNGGTGNDLLVGGAGADKLVGGDGIDTADYSASAAGVTVNLAAGTGVGGDAQGDTLSSIENVTGSKFDDVLTGDAGANVLDGGQGNDVLAGGAGADVLKGGDGVDTVDYSAALAGVTVNLAAGTASDGDTLSSIENVTGSKFDDVLTGDAGANVLDGGLGNDVLAGGAGADVLKGGDGVDTADYSAAAAGMTVNLAAGTASDGDVLSSIENVTGSKFDDVLTGDAGANVVDGGLGNDVLAGGAGADVLKGGDGVDTADYSAAATGVTVNLAAGTASDGDVLSSIENVVGSKFDDVLTGDAGVNVLDGGPGNDVLAGGAGADVLKGGDGVDTADYSAAAAGMTVNLVAGTASDGDVLSSIENVVGSKFDDVLTGDAGANVLDGGLGNDVLAGGAGADVLKGGDGVDTADYSAAAAGVTVNLAAGTASDGDTFSSIENVTGSKFDDVLTGDAGANVVDGGLGNDVLAGGAGADVLKGGDGVDTADYSAAATGVTVNLAAGTASDGDTFSSIENVTGSKFDDVLTGDAGANVLDGGLGNDVLAGGAGADVLKGGDGFDTADYSASDAGILVNAITGLVSGGHAEGDVLHSVEGFIASDFNDTFISSAAGDVFDGRGGVDTADYSASNAAVAIDLTAHTAQGGYALNDTLTNVENLIGSTFNDTLTGNELANELSGGAGQDTLQGWAGDDTLNGGAGNDRLYGGAGADHLNGGDGIDTADYSFSDAGVTVSLVSNTGSGGDAQGDVLSGIENLTGSAFDDTLTGDAGANRLVGGEGADHLYGGAGNDMILTGGGYDTVDGGDGVDTVSYENSWAGVTVNLATGVGQYGEASRDALINVEYLVGSKYDDVLTGDAGVNRLTGGAGNDTLDGGAGNDVLVGGQGADKLIGGLGDQDAASYQDANEAVIVNLATGGTGGEAAGDTYSGVEYVYGSEFNDTITGDAAINRLTGGGGDDHLDGAGGNDYLLGEAGNDTLTGGAGADVFVFDKAFGNDTITDFWAGAGRTDRAWITNTIVHSFADVAANGVDTAQGFVLTLSAHDTITFAGLNLSQFNADDFIFV
jgi:Ca2+-binding RTX toxin-like protein